MGALGGPLTSDLLFYDSQSLYLFPLSLSLKKGVRAWWIVSQAVGTSNFVNWC